MNNKVTYTTLIANKIAFQWKAHRPRTRYTNTRCHYTVCLRIVKCEVRIPGRLAADQQY